MFNFSEKEVKNKFFISFLVVALVFVFGLVFIEAATTTTYTSNTYNSTNVNVTQNQGFAHLNISRAEPYYFSSSGYGLVSYFSFDYNNSGNVMDLLTGRNATLGGNAFTTNLENAGFGNSVRFDGVGDYVNLNNSRNEVSGKNTGTLMMWFKTNRSQVTTGFLFNTGLNLTYNAALAVGPSTSDYADESMRFLVTDTGTTLLNMVVREGHDTYLDNRWHHVAVATGGSNFSLGNRIFIDGVEKTVTFATGSNTSLGFTNTGAASPAVYLGAFSQISGITEFNGSIDEFMVFNRSLTSAQIQAIYNNQSPRFSNIGNQNFTNVSVASGTSTYANISLLDYQNLLGTNISVSFDGENYTNLSSSGTLNDISYIAEGNFKNIALRYHSGDSNFYTPIAAGNLTIVSWAETGVEITDPLPTAVKNLTPNEKFIVSFNFTYNGNPIGENITINNLTIGGVEAPRVTGQLWYQSGVGWKVNATAPNDFSLQGYKNLFLNATFNNGTDNLERFDTRSGAVHFATPPLLSFVSPTPANGSSEGDIRFYNVSIYDQNLKNFSWNWNGTNYSLYDDSLVLYYTFNNRTNLGESTLLALDISPSSKNGTILGGSAFTNKGRYGATLDFDGVDDWVNTSAVLNTGNYTKVAWVNIREDTSVSNNIISGQAGHAFFVPSIVDYRLCAGHSNLTSICNSTLTFDKWHHVAVTYDSSVSGGTLKTYQDGSLVGTITGISPPTGTGSNTIQVGAFANVAFLNGTLDEVMVFNRSLSAMEIQQLYRFRVDRYNVTDWNFEISERTKPGNHTFSVGSCDTFGSCNSTSIRSLESLFSKPHVQFVSPSFSNGTYVLRGNNSPVFNFTIEEADLRNLTFEWNSTNNTLFDDNLVFRYGFNNRTDLGETNSSVIYDFSFNGWNRTILGGASYVSGGFHSGGLRFDGINDYIDAGEVLNTNSYTKVAWVKTEPKSYSQVYHNILSGIGSNGSQFWINTADKLSAGHINFTIVEDSENFGTGIWHHVAITYNSSVSNGTMILYKDGLEVDRAIGVAPPSHKTLYLGNFAPGLAGGETILNGTMDDVMLFNRSLTASEIEQLYYHRLDKYNQTMWNLQINRTNLSAQQYRHGLHACDFVGGCNSTEVRTLLVNPGMVITSPTNASPTNVTPFKNVTISFNISESGGDITENVTVNNVTMAGIQALVVGGNQYWFVSGQGWKVNVTTPNFVTYGIYGFQDLHVNASYNNGIISVESFDVETGAIHFDDTGPIITYVAPTPNDGNVEILNRSFLFNETIFDFSLKNITWNFNGTNFSVMGDDLRVYYNFDNRSALGENASLVADISRNSINGTPSGAFFNSSGKYNGAYQFDGVDDYVELPDDSFESDNVGTISIWFYPRNGTGVLFSTARTTVNNNMFRIFINGNNQISVQHFVQGSHHNNIYSFQPISLNSWHHVVLTSNGSSWNLYIDGIDVSETVFVGFNEGNWFSDLGSGTHKVRIGRIVISDENVNFSGRIDEFFILNRSINSFEADSIYQLGLTKTNKTNWNFFINETNLPPLNYTYFTNACDTTHLCTQTAIRSLEIQSSCSNFTGPNLNFICADSCVFTENKNVSGNISFLATYGAGEINLSANWTFTNPNSYIFVEPLCQVNINKSSGFNL